jgi:hypothetical protein
MTIYVRVYCSLPLLHARRAFLITWRHFWTGLNYLNALCPNAPLQKYISFCVYSIVAFLPLFWNGDLSHHAGPGKWGVLMRANFGLTEAPW